MSGLCRFAALLVALSSTPAAFAVNTRIEASAARAENISRSSSPTDRRDATRYEARTALSHFREWRTGFITSGDLVADLQRVPDYSRLDAFTAGFTAHARQKFGLGAFAPSLSANAGLRARSARLDFDDGWTATAGVHVAKRLTRSWRAALHGDWQQHYARSAIFDTKHQRLFATLTWDITERLQLSHGNGRLWGAFTANASAAVWSRALSGALGSPISSYYNTVPWAATDVFGPGWVSYRVDGRVRFWWLELSPALGRNTSLPLRYESFVSVNKVGVKYRQDVWTLSLLHRF